MKTLKRSECSVLPLVLKGKWYRMIESGEKLEEYRDGTDYWWTRIANWCGIGIYRSYIVVEFRLGYQRNAPRMAFITGPVFTPFDTSAQAKKLFVKIPRPEWGEPETPHFIITLEKRVKLED